MNSTNNLIVFCYSSKRQNFTFFKELGFTQQATHKSLEFLYVSDQPDEHMNIIPADIIFLEESATIPDNIYNTITKAEHMYLIYTNVDKQPLEKLFMIRKGNIHRKIINDGVEQKVAIQLIHNMAEAYNKRKKNIYSKLYEELISIFRNNHLYEAQLQIMHAANNKQEVVKILSESVEDFDALSLITNSLLESVNVKDILSRLASEELSNPDALLKARTQLHAAIFSKMEEAA